MKKRVLAIAMSLAMTLSLLPVSALAEETGETDVETTESDVIPQASGQITAGTESLTEGDYYLSSDVALNSALTIAAGADVTIDLGGFTLTLPNTQATEISGGSNVKISNGSIVAKSISDGTVALFNIETGSSITLDDVDVDTTGAALFPRGDAASVTVQNGSVIKAGVYAVGTNAAKTDNYNVVITLQDSEFIGEYGYNNNYQTDNCPVMINVEGVLNIDNCTITGDRQGVLVRAGTATINDSTITTTGTYTDADQYYNSAWGSGDEVPAAALTVGNYQNGAASAYLAEANVTLTNTVLNAENDFAALYVDANTTYKGVVSISGDDTEVNGSIVKGQQTALGQIDISITGGTYSSNVSKYVPENYECVKNEDNTYTVREMEAKLVVKPERGESGNISATLEGNYSSSGTQIDKPETGAGSETPETTTDHVEIDLTTNTTEDETGSTTLNITQATASSLSDASSLKVTTNEGTVELDNDALEKVGKASGTVSITVTKNSTASENNVAASYTVEVKSNGNDLLPDGQSNGTITLTLPVPAASQSATLYVWYAVAQTGGGVMYVNQVATYNANSGAVVTFDVSHLSRYDLLSSEPNANETAVASITKDGQTTYYNSLQAAVNAVRDDTQTTIKLLKTMEGNGVKVEATKNIIFDLNGNTYTINTSTVGSTGTETNGFQLLKGNTITIKNGTLKPGSSAKILLQNYSDLTLENVTVDCGGATQCQYAMSNNFGETEIKDSSIIAPPNGVAFDVYYWPSNSYGDGVTVTVKNSEINGKIEYGSDGTDTGKNDVAEKATLNVESGTFVNTGDSIFSVGTVGTDGKTGITVSGGNFSSSVPEEYLVESLTAELYSTRRNPDAPYSYYTSVKAAIDASQPGDTVTALNATTTDTCTVTINYGYGSNSTVTVAANSSITLPNPGTRTGYTFNGWRSSADNDLHKAGTSVTITADTTFTANWTRNQTDRPSGGGSSSSDSGDYLISVDRVSGGRVTVQPGRADRGDTVTITVYPNDGYELDELVVTDSRGNEIDLDARSATRFTFTMPSGKVTVEASFVREGGQPQVPQTTFADVPASAWYYDAVEYVYENGLMSGVSGGRFAPDDTLTRAMLVQTLYAMEGRPAAASAGFADVASGDWYTSAVNWAAANGVVSGVSETGFGPNNALTREQLALILYRFAQYKGYDVTGTSDLAAYADGSSVSGWAAEAMGWAVDAGLISGVGGNQIAPTGTASRAQVAQILMNFCENVAR